MKPDGPIDYAVFQLSPRRSRCELLISSNGNTEKLASGLVKPFVAQLKAAEEQFAKMVQYIKLEVGKGKNVETWFTRGTLERFVRFVSTPEILELVNNLDAEMSQLEAARKIYLQGQGTQHSVASGEDEAGIALAADATKKELLRAIDVRLAALRQDLSSACARACAAGFHPDSVSELMLFADCFGADRLNEACTKFLSLCQRRPDLLSAWSSVSNERVRSSCESDMSLDDPTEDLSVPMKQQVNQSRSSTDQEPCSTEKNEIQPDQLKASISDQLKSFSTFVSDRKNDNQKTEEKDKKDQQSGSQPIQTSNPTRRLSVQDRINLFESKQKENVISGSGSGSKPAVGKSAELRRLSSDVSSAPSAVEKAVLRRWSGASDMSIDLSTDKKDHGNSPLCTPSSASVSQAKGHVASTLLEDRSQKGLHDGADSLKADGKSLIAEVDTALKDQSDILSNASLSGKDQGSGVGESSAVMDSAISQAWSFSVREQQREISYEENTEEKMEFFLGSGGGIGKEKVDSEKQLMGLAQDNDVIGLGNQAASVSNALSTLSKIGHISRKNETGRAMDNDRSKDLRASRSKIRGFHGHSRSFSGQLEGSSVLKIRDTQEKGSGGDRLAEQPRWRSFLGESEQTSREIGGVEKVQIMAEEFLMQKMKSPKPVPVGSEQIKRTHGKRDGGGFSNPNSKPTLSSRKVPESHEAALVSPPVQSEQVQRARHSKGNQELNDELKMKANELEKLFAEHKQRVPGDQSSSARRSRPPDLQKESMSSSQPRKSLLTEAASSSLPEKSVVPEARVHGSSPSGFTTPPSMTSADAEESSSILRRNFSDLSYSDESRGKFYEKYTKRRDAKLREEWGSKRAEKEAKLKAMHDRLEQSTAEMKAKFSGSADRQQSSYTARLRAEKVRSYNGRSNVKEQQMDLNQSDEEETATFSELIQDDSFGESYVGDSASRSTLTKKAFPNRTSASSNTRNTAIPISRSSKAPYSSGRRKAPYDYPVAQSVPNFSELRKENTKPSLGLSKAGPRSQGRGFTQSRSTNEDMPLVKEDKTRRTQSVRKVSGDPAECTELSASKIDGNILATLEVDQTGQGKGNGTITVRKGHDASLKAAIPSGKIMDEGSDDSDALANDVLAMVRGEDDEETENAAIQNVETMHLSTESDDSLKSGSENGDSLTSLSRVDPASAADLAASMSLKYQARDPLRGSPNESPVSWNSRVHHLFSYPHDNCDIDASVDSPVGSPASWNSHTLGQTEGDSARMRKKWGSSSKPFFVANTSHGQSRKDMTKGFKRLLKFGRKSRGTESMVDWISATTSEGDDDTEDGRDSVNRSSEDLRKSRMGFQQGHPSDDSFNESELLNDHVEALRSSIPAPPANFKLQEDQISGSSLRAPKSFFSLSTFRSKGSDAKPR